MSMVVLGLLPSALRMEAAGLCVVPARADGSKAPFGAWKTYQTTRPTTADLAGWLSGSTYDGIGVIAGQVSGQLEMFEAEARACEEGTVAELEQLMVTHGYGDLWARLDGGYVERTPSGGLHWYYRVSNGPANRNVKLARRPATDTELARAPDDRVKVLLETRGEGGFSITAPSNGRTHPDGGTWEALAGNVATIPAVTVEERDILHAVASMLDRMPAVTHDQPSTPRPTDGAKRPGDDYNDRADWADILGPHGWRLTMNLGAAGLGWCRPGKTGKHISATTGRNDGDNLYVFSSSTVFDTEKPYSKFAAHTLLDHGGDYTAAAKALRAAGYGDTALDLPVTVVGDISPVVTPDAAEKFWAARPEIERLRQFARARMCSPWAVLGCALARVVVAVPPFMVLPALVGSEASLNLFVALVGPSGTGKGAAEAAAADAIDVGHLEVAHVGSGEGIAHLYAHRDKGEVVRDRDAVLFIVPEVDNLVALTGRQGATLLPQLRMAWSGERLGFAYVDKTKNLPIDRHTYRLGLLLGVQPGRAAPLLDDTDGGTPQRFLWMPTTDPDVPDEPPTVPDPIHWSLPAVPQFAADLRGLVPIGIPDQARTTVQAARRDRLRGDGDTLDGHALLARLKVAAALALLAGRRDVNDQDWALSETVMAVSDATRAGVRSYLGGRARAVNTARGEAEADRAILVADKLDAAQVRRVCGVIGRALRRGQGEWMTRRDVAVTVAGRDRAVLDDALGALLDAGQVETQDDAGKPLYRLTDGD